MDSSGFEPEVSAFFIGKARMLRHSAQCEGDVIAGLDHEPKNKNTALFLFLLII